jgi:phage terminase large subunit
MKLRTEICKAVGRGYGEFWRFRGRYRVVKGSRASKKSKTAALYFIFNIMKYDKANLLVVRKTYRTLKASCFEELRWAIGRLGAERFWAIKESPLEMEYLPTGQKIYFRGLDDPLKVTSITVRHGALCWMWIEEAYEISNEDDFNVLDESIRGSTPGLFKQITLTLNPWNENHWIKKRFFDEKSDDVLAITTNYKINEFLDEADIKVFETMKERNPARYAVAGLGEWGVCEGCVFENKREERFDENTLKGEGFKSVFGLDFGYVNDPTALFCGIVDEKNKKLYVFDEMYEKGLSNEAIYKKIFEMGYTKERIRADCSEPKSIDRLRELGLTRIRAAKKGADSVRHGIDRVREYEIVVHPRCVNFLTEIENYCWEKDRDGKITNYPTDRFNHLMDAMRYAMEDVGDTGSFTF